MFIVAAFLLILGTGVPVAQAQIADVFHSGELDVKTPEVPLPEIQGKLFDSLAIWAHYSNLGESEYWNQQLAETFKEGFQDARTVECEFLSDFDGSPAQFEDARWVLKLLLSELKSNRTSASEHSLLAKGKYELFDYGRPIKEWEFSEEIVIVGNVFQGVRSEDIRKAHGPLSRNVARKALDLVYWKAKEIDDLAAGGASKNQIKVFVGKIIGGADSREIRNATQAALIHTLDEWPEYDPVSEEDAKAILNAMALQQMLGCTEDACMLDIASQVGAADVVYGQGAVVGARFQLTLTRLNSGVGQKPLRARRDLPANLKVLQGAVQGMLRQLFEESKAGQASAGEGK